jgi:hypothetical protein
MVITAGSADVDQILGIASKVWAGRLDGIRIVIAKVDGTIPRTGDSRAGGGADVDAGIEVVEVYDSGLDIWHVCGGPIPTADGNTERRHFLRVVRRD